MQEESSFQLFRTLFEQIRDKADFALRRIKELKDPQSMRWRCKECRWIKHFTRPVPLETAGRCPRCKSTSFEPCEDTN